MHTHTITYLLTYNLSVQDTALTNHPYIHPLYMFFGHYLNVHFTQADTLHMHLYTHQLVHTHGDGVPPLCVLCGLPIHTLLQFIHTYTPTNQPVTHGARLHAITTGTHMQFLGTTNLYTHTQADTLTHSYTNKWYTHMVFFLQTMCTIYPWEHKSTHFYTLTVFTSHTYTPKQCTL